MTVLSTPRFSEGRNPGLADWASGFVSTWMASEKASDDQVQLAMHRHQILKTKNQRKEESYNLARELKNVFDASRRDIDPSNRHHVPTVLAALLLLAIFAFDVKPLFWGAESFGLGTFDTWVVTGLFLAGSVIFSWMLEAAPQEKRRMVWILLSVTFGALAALRTEFLLTVGALTLGGAVLEAALLSAISMGLVVLGSQILARTRRLRVRSALVQHRNAEEEATKLARDARDAREAFQAAGAEAHRSLRIYFMQHAPTLDGASSEELLGAVTALLDHYISGGGRDGAASY